MLLLAIIFLAPISAFDQVLAEDRSVNRLVRTHSNNLYQVGIHIVNYRRTVYSCGRKYAPTSCLPRSTWSSSSTSATFLSPSSNPASGWPSMCVASESERTIPRSRRNVSPLYLYARHCLMVSSPPDFRSKFSAIHREHSPIPRKFYGFCTSVTVSTIHEMLPELLSQCVDRIPPPLEVSLLRVRAS